MTEPPLLPVSAAEGRSLRVVFLNWRDTRNPEGGGSEVYVESVARALVAAGHQVTIFCATYPQAADDEIVDGVRFVRAGSKLGVYPAALGRLIFRRFGPIDVVVDVQNGMPFLSRLATRKPVVVLVHHVHREQWPVVYDAARATVGWWIESWVAPRLYRRSQYVAVSELTARELGELGVSPDRISVVRNGTDPIPFQVVGRSPQPRILVLGRLVPHKRVEHVLEAAALLRVDHPGLTVAVVGDGWWSESLKQRATELGVDDLVDFVGFVDEQQKHEELARAWLLALPSLKEGWGLVVMEAAGHGAPAVAYRDAGGVAESIVDEVTGLLVDGDSTDFTAAVGRLLGDSTLRDRLGNNARARAGTFRWDQTAKEFSSVLGRATDSSVVAGRGPEVSPAQVTH